MSRATLVSEWKSQHRRLQPTSVNERPGQRGGRRRSQAKCCKCVGTVRAENPPEFDSGWLSANLVISKSHFGRVEGRRDLESIVDEQMNHLGNFPTVSCCCGGPQTDGARGDRRSLKVFPHLPGQGQHHSR